MQRGDLGGTVILSQSAPGPQTVDLSPQGTSHLPSHQVKKKQLTIGWLTICTILKGAVLFFVFGFVFCPILNGIYGQPNYRMVHWPETCSCRGDGKESSGIAFQTKGEIYER